MLKKFFVSFLFVNISLLSFNVFASYAAKPRQQVSASKTTAIAVFERNTAAPEIFYKLGKINQQNIDWLQAIKIGKGETPDIVISPDSTRVFLTYLIPNKDKDKKQTLVFKIGTISDDEVKWQNTSDVLPKAIYGVSPRVLLSGNKVSLLWLDSTSNKKNVYIHTLNGKFSEQGSVHWQDSDSKQVYLPKIKAKSSISSQAIKISSIADEVCPNGVLTGIKSLALRTQDDVDLFGKKYNGCHYIDTKDVQIGLGDITDLSPLSGVNEIWGDLEVKENSALESLSGLDNLTSVSGNISISNNPKLANVNALSNLTHVFGDLEVIGNTMLTDLTGLDNITAIEGSMVIHADGMTAIDDLNSLIRIGHNFTLRSAENGITANNKILTSVDGFQSLSYVGNDVDISFNDQLASISGFSNLETVNGSFSIEYSDSLKSLQGFSALTTVNHDFQVSYTSITNLDNFVKLRKVNGSVSITDNPELAQISSLKNLLITKGELYVSRNKSLKSLEGLNNVSLLSVPDSDTTLFLQDNLVLSDCSAICDIYNDLSVNKVISGNDGGCSTTLKSCR